MMDYAKEAMKRHYEWRGKLDIVPKMGLETTDDLSVAYTPGVAAPCLAIKEDISKSYDLTGRWNTVAVITDGSAVLGLGDIGPEAGMPVMEGKCVLFKAFAGVDAIPLCIRSKDPDEIVRAVELLAGSFGGINLEDISAPRCFDIERRLKESCDIPVFHDDQHGTAVVTLAAMINALKISGRTLEGVSMVISGAGAAAAAIAKLLMSVGLKDVVLCNRSGAIYDGREGLNPEQAKIGAITNPKGKKGSLADVLRGADVFIGVSAPGLVTQDMIRSMAPNPVILPMANPVPEIMPEEAMAAGASLIGTGRSDYPNQINNVLAFPGIFRGALDARASDINDAMKIAAAKAIAGLIPDSELSPGYFIPAPLDKRVAPAVAEAVKEAAAASGVARNGTQ
jgi:malate dehydrogenase (oxaloacetate-decarboxylating)